MFRCAIVEIEIPSNRGACVWYAVVAVQIDLLVLHRPPEPFDEHVVPPRALAVHADGDLILDEHAGEVCPGELAALIGVDDLRPPMPGQSILQRLDAERGLHRDGDTPRQHAPREPVEHCGEIDEAFRHRDIGDVHRPDLVRPHDFHAAQQIGIDLVPRLRLRRARAPVERLNAHAPHQRFDVTPAGLAPLGSQKTAQHPCPCEGKLQMQLVDLAHEGEIGRRHRARQVIHRAACEAGGLGLFRDA